MRSCVERCILVYHCPIKFPRVLLPNVLPVGVAEVVGMQLVQVGVVTVVVEQVEVAETAMRVGKRRNQATHATSVDNRVTSRITALVDSPNYC
jgi:hypothetical protein